MPNPGKFRGKRKEFLTEKRALFDASVDNDRVPDVLMQIFRAYFKRFPMELPEDVDPTDEALAMVDDNAPEPEVDTTSLDELSGEAYEAALEKMREGRDALESKKGQIKRWFYYRYMRDHAHDPRSTDPSNPYNAIIMQLSGANRAKRPRCKAPVNIWCKEPSSVKAIQAEWDKIPTTIDSKKRAAKRAEVASTLFKDLPEEKKKEYADRAKEEHEAALEKWRQASMGSISTAPADRQRCISALPQFVQPWLDALAHATGFKFALTAGGPEPIRGGRLNVISMYSGTTNGAVPLTFGQAERDGFVEVLLPRFGRYLKSCYTPEECRSRALVAPNLHSSLQSVAMDEGAVFHSFGLHTTDSGRPETLNTTAAVSRMDNSLEGERDPPDPNTTTRTALSSGEAGVPASTPSASTDASPDTPGAPSATAVLLDGVNNALADTIQGSERGPHCPSLAPASPIDSALALQITSPPTADASSATAVLLDGVNKALADTIQGSERGSHGPSLAPSPIDSAPASRIASPPATPIDVNHPRRMSGQAVLSREGTAAPLSESTGVGGLKRALGNGSPISPSKRMRTHFSISDHILPPDAPDWIKKATHMLQSGRYPGRWQELIAAWLVYESRNNFEDNGKLSPKGRPKVVAEWFKNARKASFTPKPLPNIALIEREHTAWWRSMQPASRVQGDGTLAAATTCTDWPQLRAIGLNGMLSVLASLFFWGMSMTRADADTLAWEAAVDDCLSVIQQLPRPH